jgi:DNA-binding MarR family transcriptional regulator
LQDLGVTPAWAEAIEILNEGSPLTVKELGDLLVCERNHPSRLVERMVRAGLLERAASSADTRAVELRLSTVAQDLVPRVRAIEEALYDLIDATLPDPAVATVIESLNTLVSGTPSGAALERRRRHQQLHHAGP